MGLLVEVGWYSLADGRDWEFYGDGCLGWRGIGGGTGRIGIESAPPAPPRASMNEKGKLESGELASGLVS